MIGVIDWHCSSLSFFLLKVRYSANKQDEFRIAEIPFLHKPEQHGSVSMVLFLRSNKCETSSTFPTESFASRTKLEIWIPFNGLHFDYFGFDCISFHHQSFFTDSSIYSITVLSDGSNCNVTDKLSLNNAFVLFFCNYICSIEVQNLCQMNTI